MLPGVIGTLSVDAMATDRDVEYGAHLPLIDLGEPRSLPALRAYVRAAASLGLGDEVRQLELFGERVTSAVSP